jgi:L-fuculose-phosphate aldolase
MTATISARSAPSSITMNEQDLRQEIVDSARAMNAMGINQGTSGNISARMGDTMLITPSATAYDAMRPDQVAAMPIDGPGDGRCGAWTGPLKPSTEWRLHLDILRGRPDAGAVVHSHATFCTTLAIARREIPACHYMIAAFGGTNVRCAPYATFGTAELARHALTALEDRSACLLANHGMIVMGATLAKAMWLALELETIAKQYCHSLLIGTPHILTDAEVADTARSFAGYGLQDAAD